MTHDQSNPTIDIFLATSADREAVCELLRGQFAEHAWPLAEAQLSAGVAGLLDDPARGLVLLARETGQISGLALLAHTWTVEHGGPVVWLEELYVVPGRRGAGIGTRLLERAIAEARQRGCRAIDLEVDDEHARAAHLYQRAWFRPLSRKRWTLSLAEAG